MKQIKIFLLGAVGYGLLEILWRGYTHPTMPVVGGICLLFIEKIAVFFRALPLFKKSLLSSAVITATELSVGVIVNLYLGLNVWDYSSLPFSILGQISLFYSFLWFLLSAVMIKIFDWQYRFSAAKKQH